MFKRQTQPDITFKYSISQIIINGIDISFTNLLSSYYVTNLFRQQTAVTCQHRMVAPNLLSYTTGQRKQKSPDELVGLYYFPSVYLSTVTFNNNFVILFHWTFALWKARHQIKFFPHIYSYALLIFNLPGLSVTP